MNIADRYIALREQAKALEAEMDLLKKEFIATGIERLAADEYDLAMVHQLSERGTIDKGLLAQFLTADQIKACTKVTQISSVTVKENIRRIAA
jgi:hypothetical protein